MPIGNVMMEYFYIDESGYTGFDLLNLEQRFQGASAVAISDDEAARLIHEYFPTLQAPDSSTTHSRVGRATGSRCWTYCARCCPNTSA